MIQKNATLNFNKIPTGFIALLPVIMLYKFPFSELSCATVLVILFSYVFLLAAIKGIFKDKRKAYGIPLLFFYCGWAAYNSIGSVNNLILVVMVFIYIMAIATSNIFDVYFARKIVENMAIVSAVVVIIQYALHYTVGVSTLVVCVKPWVIQMLQHRIPYTGGLFRPSAFFSEPAHLAEYCIVGLLSTLFRSADSKVNLRKALIITLGILMSTSGMGTILSVAAWVVYILIFWKKGMLLDRILIILSIGSLVSIILMQFDFFTMAIKRVFSNVDGYNAISGRLFWWDAYFTNLSIHDWIFGLGYSALPPDYFTGFMEVVYTTGVIGVALLILTIINCILRMKGFYFYLGVFYLGMLYPSNLINFINMIFFLSFIYSGYISEPRLKNIDQS